MQSMTTLRRDYIASNLRAQINRLHAILDIIENDGTFDHDYANFSLRDIVQGLRQLRAMCGDA